MRFVTNMVSKGKSDYNLRARNVLQLMYNEYIQISPHIHRELNKKIHQHKGSMLKVMSKLEPQGEIEDTIINITRSGKHHSLFSIKARFLIWSY